MTATAYAMACGPGPRSERAQNWARSERVLAARPFGSRAGDREITPARGPRPRPSRFGAGSRARTHAGRHDHPSGRISVKLLPSSAASRPDLEPNWVISMGASPRAPDCVNNYALVAGADNFLPVDVLTYPVPPRPEPSPHGF